MTLTNVSLAKRTKQEILEEYEKLQDQLEDVRSTAQNVYGKPAVELLERTKTKTPMNIDKVFSDFQTALNVQLTDVRTSLLEQTATLQELQKAIELSRQQLELQHHITIAADTLDLLLEEYKNKSLMFDTDTEKKKRELDEQIAQRKKSWEREAEEYEYQKKLKRERDQIEIEAREKILLMRESNIKTQEQEVTQMKKTIEQFPKDLEQALEKCEQNVSARLAQQFTHEKILLEKETDAQIRLLELTVKNLQDRCIAQEQECTSLKQQTQEANAKAQTLAVKAIERPTTIVTPLNANATNPTSFHDRDQ